MDKRLKKLWVADLRSGRFVQATGSLRKTQGHGKRRAERNGYCCLGVLSCRLARNKAVKATGWKWKGALWQHSDGRWRNGLLPEDVRAVCKLSLEQETELTRMNDGAGASFSKIANYLETNL